MGVAIRRGRAEDVDFVAELMSHEDVEPFLGAVTAKDRDTVAAEIERSEREPHDFGRFVIEADGAYRRTERLGFEAGDSVEDLLSAAAEPAHILVISPEWLFRSPTPEQLGPGRKLVAMPCNSTPTSLEAVLHFLEAMERTDPSAQQAFADRFFELAEESAGGDRWFKVLHPDDVDRTMGVWSACMASGGSPRSGKTPAMQRSSASIGRMKTRPVVL